MRRFAITLSALYLAGLLAGCERETRVENVPPPATADKTDKSTPRAGDLDAAALPVGERVDSAVAYDIYQVLGQAANAAVKPDTFDDLIERFSASDRARFKGARGGALDAESSPVRDAWTSRYEGPFNIDDSPAVFSPIVRIEALGQSEEKERARVFLQPPTGVTGQQIELMLVKETNWRLDVPDHFDTETLRQLLAETLTKMHQDHANWPTERLVGEQYVGYHVLAAVAGKPSAGAAPGQPPGGAAPGQKPGGAAPGQPPAGTPR